MQLAMIGLGRMGAGMAERLARGGHRVHGFDPLAAARSAARMRGVVDADSLAAAIAPLPSPRIAWMMVPAGPAVDDAIAELRPLLRPDDILIDGGNSNYRDTMRRARALHTDGIAYLDCGTSGGIWGPREGYSLMIGGDADAIEHLRPLWSTLAPGADIGWGRVGPSGAGHFAKMVHNGIEYGLMQAYAEGFSMLQHKHELDLDPHQIAKIWRHGSVIRSWLLDLAADLLEENPGMTGIAARVADSGEGRWAVAEAIELGVPAPVITLSLLARLRSRDSDAFADKLLAALRGRFGGHAIAAEDNRAAPR